MPEDTDLLQRFVRADDQEAFGELVRRQVNFVYSAALRQVGGDDHLARDVTQSVFMAFARSAPRLLGRPTLGGWLYTTTRYLSAKAVRSHRRWRHREQEAQAMRIIDKTGAAEPNWEQLRPVLDAAMHQLSASDREAVLLRYFEGLPFGEVGVRCALSENSARMRVDRALEKLRVQLEKRGVSSTAAALGLALSSHAVIAAPAGLAAAASGAALAALGSGAAAGLLKFSLSMSTTKITIGVVGALCLFAAGSATYEAAAARRAEASLVQVREADTARIHELQAQVAALKTRAGPTAAATAALNGTGAPTGVTAGDDRNGSAGNGGKPGSHLAALLGTLNGPTVDIPVKIQLENQYAALFKSLNLTPEQADQFKNLLFEKRAAALDTIAAAMGQGIDATTDARTLYLAVVAAEKDANTQLGTLLGPDGYKQYQQYTQNLPALTTANQLQQSLSYTSTPLTDDQTSRLNQILKQYSPAAVPEPFALLNGDLGVTIFTDQALAEAQTVLSAPQLQALQNQIAQQHQLLIAREQMK